MSSSRRSHIAAPLTEEEIERRAQALALAVQQDFEDLVELSTTERGRFADIYTGNQREKPWGFLYQLVSRDMADSNRRFPRESMDWFVHVQQNLPTGDVDSSSLNHILAVLQYIRQDYHTKYEDSIYGKTLSTKELVDALSAAVKDVLVSPLSVPPSTPVV